MWRRTAQSKSALTEVVEAVPDQLESKSKFKTRWYHRRPAYWFLRNRDRKSGSRPAPEVLRLDVTPGVMPSGKLPVRVFIGTEPAQYRAERILIWSILQHRDPSRVYEIYLMKDLAGFDRRGWGTGFTNYRYAIPWFAGGKGRAIYNDVDQMYCADPAELFDMDMGGAGVLSVTERETSVMLIDCARMTGVWSLERARNGGRHDEFRSAIRDNRLWARLPVSWNARDEEYHPGESKCFHFTTLHTQPWRPFPEQIRYRPHRDGEAWYSLERAADAAGFTPFTKQHPSRRHRELLEQYRILHAEGERHLGLAAEETFDGRSLTQHESVIARLINATGATTLLDYGAGKGGRYRPHPGEPETGPIKEHPAWPGVRVTCYDPAYTPLAGPYDGRFDGVISTDVLEHIPEEDIGWVLDDMFSAARRFVYLVAACYPARKVLPNGENAHCTLLPPEWWRGQVEMAARRHHGITWTICAKERTFLGKKSRYYASGGLRDRADGPK